jgi:hypothetical protein
MHIEYDKLDEKQKVLVRAMFHPTKSGYDAYLYELTQGGWVLSRRKRKSAVHNSMDDRNPVAGEQDKTK